MTYVCRDRRTDLQCSSAKSLNAICAGKIFSRTILPAPITAPWQPLDSQLLTHVSDSVYFCLLGGTRSENVSIFPQSIRFIFVCLSGLLIQRVLTQEKFHYQFEVCTESRGTSPVIRGTDVVVISVPYRLRRGEIHDTYHSERCT